MSKKYGRGLRTREEKRRGGRTKEIALVWCEGPGDREGGGEEGGVLESGFSIRESTGIQELCLEAKPFHLTKHCSSPLRVRYFRTCSMS